MYAVIDFDFVREDADVFFNWHIFQSALYIPDVMPNQFLQRRLTFFVEPTLHAAGMMHFSRVLLHIFGNQSHLIICCQLGGY